MDKIQRILDLSVIWKQAAAVFPYFDRAGIDWDQTYRNYLPKVLQEENELAFHLLLAEFLNQLGDGHTDYIFPHTLSQATGFLPFSLRFHANGCYLHAVSTAYRPFLGDCVQGINGRPWSDYAQQLSRYGYHIGAWIAPYPLRRILPLLLKPAGNRMETDQGVFSFDLCPAQPENLVSLSLTAAAHFTPVPSKTLDIRRYAGNILLIRLDDLMHSGVADEVRAALEQMPPDGLILDLRENIGGMTRYGAEIAELLIPGAFGACQKWTRSMTGVGLASASQIAAWSQQEIQQAIACGNATQAEMDKCQRLLHQAYCDCYEDRYGEEGRAAVYNGPCLLLTSRYTASAAEDLVAMFRTNHRARICGTPTSGTTGTPLLQKLSLGGGFRICSVGYRLLDGTEFIGQGIQPDIPCAPSLNDLRQGRDSVLEKALEMLRY